MANGNDVIWRTLDAYRMVSIFAQIHCGRTITFSELQRNLRGITAATLSTRLKELKQAGWLERQIYQDNPPRFAYVLTPLGAEVRKEIAAQFYLGSSRG